MSLILDARSNNVTKISLSKQFYFFRVGKRLLDRSILRNPLSINPSQLKKSSKSEISNKSRKFISELLIRSLKVSLYLLEIAIISNFLSVPSTV